MKLPWINKQEIEEKGYGKDLKDGDAIVSYNLKQRSVLVKFHNTVGGAILPFSFIKETALAIAKIEEHGIIKE